jgi:hypothetical protein
VRQDALEGFNTQLLGRWSMRVLILDKLLEFLRRFNLSGLLLFLDHLLEIFLAIGLLQLNGIALGT